MSLIKKVQNTCFQHNLLKYGDKIIVAVSGGPDSVCLLDIFSKLQKKYSLELIIVHVNYGLRGKDSNADEKFVRKLTEKYGLKIEVLALSSNSSPEYERGGLNSSENYLRDIRYNFFEKLRAQNNFDSIAVAHNLDDQVETFLMRLIRGTGTDGLTAMKFKNNFLIRPLLSTTRQEILKYLKANKLNYRIDKTNLKNNFSRNKIRNKLVPFLEKNFNPNIKKTISNSLISISEDSDFLEKITANNFSTKGGSVSNRKIKKLEKLHPAILRRVIRKNLENIKGNTKDISANNIEEIIKIIKSKKNKTQTVIMSGLKITRKNDKLIIEKN